MKNRFPIFIFLDRIRSLHNVGAFFRTADAIHAEKIFLSEYTPQPPRKEITKTALGAEHTVPFEIVDNPLKVIKTLKKEGVLIIAIETGKDTISYIDYIPPTFPICLIFGNEITGISQDILALADKKISIPMYGIKESLNVSVAGGVILYNMLEKYLHTTDIKRNTLQ